MATSKKFCTLSFSGAGTLLPYHLGVARTLRDSSKASSMIRAVAGSSSGAIAATLLALFPERIEEYAESFLNEGGRGLTLIQNMLEESSNLKKADEGRKPDSQRNVSDLFICATKGSDGSTRLFHFSSKQNPLDDANLFPSIHASCFIPKSFHPLDVFSKQSLSYPDGIEIDGHLYCDGGISSPAPVVPIGTIGEGSAGVNITISPISGPSANGSLCIRPRDSSFSLPMSLTARCGSFRVKPSMQNLKAAFAAIGAVSPDVLRDWYALGAHDASEFLLEIGRDE